MTRLNCVMAGLAAAVLAGSCALAEEFKAASPAFADGGRLPMAQVLNAMGCEGGNRSPALSWSGAPAGTKSFAVTLYDPKAPTGSGWWHWVVYDLPAGAKGIAEGATPAPAVQGRTDFGTSGYGGACPPVGGEAHPYIFTVHALDVERLGVAVDASAAMVGYNLYAHTLARSTVTALYGR